MSEPVHTYMQCPTCLQWVRASKHTEAECKAFKAGIKTP